MSRSVKNSVRVANRVWAAEDKLIGMVMGISRRDRIAAINKANERMRAKPLEEAFKKARRNRKDPIKKYNGRAPKVLATFPKTEKPKKSRGNVINFPIASAQEPQTEYQLLWSSSVQRRPNRIKKG